MHYPRNVARHTARSHRRAQQRPKVPRATDSNKTWSESGPPSNGALPSDYRGPVCALGTQRGHLRTPRRGATARAACVQAAAAGDGCKEDVGRDRRGATSRAACLQAAAGDRRKEDEGQQRPAGQQGVAGGESGAVCDLGKQAICASADAKARRNSAGRIRAGARGASNTMWHGARRYHNVARNSAPRHGKRRTQRRRGARAAGRAARSCRRRVRRTACKLGTHRGHLRTPRRSARRNNAHRIFASRRRGRRTQRNRGARAAGRATSRCWRRIGRTVCDLGKQRGHLRTLRKARQGGPHLCKPPGQSERREQSDVAWRTARERRVARNNPP